jgi:ATP-dependent helicase/nuclease subunit B
MGLNLFTLPAEIPFLDAIATTWLARAGNDPLAIARGIILLPTRRAARSLAEAFLRAGDGRPMLLPRITALGALDEAPLAMAGALDLPPAITPMARLATLSRLILGMRGEGGAPTGADRAWPLAVELAALMDEAERAEIDLGQRLPDAADPEFAEHWGRTLAFLGIVTKAWPDFLTESRLMNPAARQVALLNAQARAWTDSPPDHPILIAGTTAGIPAVARLLRVVARLPNGEVVLPALDLGMTDAAWDAIEPSHPQAGLAALLAGLDARRGDVRQWGDARAKTVATRFATFSTALLPAAALDAWRAPGPVALDGVRASHPQDPQEEADAIALILRETLETPGALAALVTPDRGLATRVTAALARAGIVADDSAGERLKDTPPAVFLRLLARATAERLAPAPLLALLKHPLAALGLYPAQARAEARALERAVLRGPRPGAGIGGLRKAVDAANEPRVKAFLAQIEQALEPLLRLDSAAAAPLTASLDALLQAAERLATTVDQPGATRLWAGEEGAALAETLAELRGVLATLPDQRRGVLPGFLDAVLEGAVVRGRRALRGRDGVEHPRVFIWGLLEARLQHVDRLVLGGLVEGVWPPATDPGPWLSRPMRTRVGLPSPEVAVGLAAHDFLSLVCASPEVVLSCPDRRDHAPAVPARWLSRLDAYLSGQNGIRLPTHPAVIWARALDLPPDGPRPVAPPAPNPPVHRRPRRLSVTEIETWLRDPYAIYARHILGLKKLDPLDQETDAADYGSIVHDGLHAFLRDIGAGWPDDAAPGLRRSLEHALARSSARPALAAWWAPRLLRIADWIAAHEAERRRKLPVTALHSEVTGRITLARPGGAFQLVGRADRIEVMGDGTLTLIDYKTGTPPSRRDIARGYAAQLLLEAVMARAGGFQSIQAGEAVSLLYWRLTGGLEPGTETAARKPDELTAAIDEARIGLENLIDRFDREEPYLSQPAAAAAPRFSDYARLARVAEWSQAGDDEERDE